VDIIEVTWVKIKSNRLNKRSIFEEWMETTIQTDRRTTTTAGTWVNNNRNEYPAEEFRREMMGEFQHGFQGRQRHVETLHNRHNVIINANNMHHEDEIINRTIERAREAILARDDAEMINIRNVDVIRDEQDPTRVIIDVRAERYRPLQYIGIDLGLNTTTINNATTNFNHNIYGGI